MSQDPGSQSNQPVEWGQSEVEAALPAFVLGALEPDEMLAVDAYLRDHAEMRRRADELAQATLGLAYSVPPVAPPPAISAQILGRVEHEVASQAAPSVPASPAPLPTAHRRPGFGARFRQWWRINAAPAAVGATAALLLLLTGAYVTQLRSQVDDLQTQIAANGDQVAALEAELADLTQINAVLQEQLQSRDAQFADFANADTVLALAGTDDAPDAGAVFTLTDDQATLIAYNLPAIDAAQQTYQLWLIPEDGAPVPSGLLAAQPGEPATWSTTVPLQTGDFALVGLSIEPAGGSAAPTGPIVLLGG